MVIQNRLEPRSMRSTGTEDETEIPLEIERTKPQTANPEAEEEEKKSQVQLFSTTSAIHPEPKKKSRFMKLLKGSRTEEDEE